MQAHMTRIRAEAKRAIGKAADLLWPRRSILSGAPSTGAVTPEEFAKLQFIGAPLCDRCGLPQSLDLGPQTLCAACIAQPPRWNRARAALRYNDISRRPILALKRAGRRDGLDIMANWMLLAGDNILNEADIILPVPLHYRRLVSRGFNQSGWLADRLALKANLPLSHTALRRHKHTSSQEGLSARARRLNVRGAFTISPRSRHLVTGKRVCLIDDVFTTGATLNACTKVLLEAGARNVDVLVLARVIRETDITAG